MIPLLKTARPTLAALLLLTILCGGVYPLLTTIIVQTVFYPEAEGSLIHDASGQVIGSSLIGQNFTKPGYLWGRLSATSPNAYNAGASSGSNFGVNNPALMDAAKARIAALKAGAPNQTTAIPIDLVTASASGLDPDISPAAAAYQIPRIAQARHVPEASVAEVIRRSTKGRTFGLLGEPRVNVLEVNLRLDGKLT